MTRTREEFAAVIDTLTKDLDQSLIKTRIQGGQDIAYIEWHTAADLLDKNAPGWECQIKDVQVIQRDQVPLVMTRVAITIDGITRENIGSEALLAGVAQRDGGEGGFGDPFSNSFSQAFKRAATLFGVGRSLYKKDEGSPNATTTDTPASGTLGPKRGRPAGSKNAITPSNDFVEAELGPEASGTSAKGPYTYYPVHVGEKEYKHFFTRDYSLGNLMNDLSLIGDPVFPIKLEVRLEKKGNFLNVAAFRPRQQAVAEAQSVENKAYAATAEDVPF